MLEGVLATDYIVEELVGHLPRDEEAGGRRGMMFRMGKGQPTLGGSCKVLIRDSKRLLGRNKLRLAE